MGAKEDAIACAEGLLDMIPPGLSDDDQIPPDVIEKMRDSVESTIRSLE